VERQGIQSTQPTIFQQRISIFNRHRRHLACKAKVNEDLEFYSVIRAVKAVDEADVCLLLDAKKWNYRAGFKYIFSCAKKKRKKGIVVLVNKWDDGKRN